MSKPEEEKMVFPPPSDVLYKIVMNRSKEIKGEKPREDDGEFNWDDLDPDEPAAAETLAALEVEFLANDEDVKIITKALSSAWRLIRSLQGELNDERARRARFEDGFAAAEAWAQINRRD